MPTPPKKPVKPAPKPVSKKNTAPPEDDYFEKLRKENLKRMQAASEKGRRNYKPGGSTGRSDTDAARKAGYAK